jgi:photosystem II stability/assembly factor-like uncharacterized protein
VKHRIRLAVLLVLLLSLSVLGIVYAPARLPGLQFEREGAEAEPEGLRWMYAMRAYPSDTISPEAPLRAWEQLQRARSTQRANAARATWVPVGPAPIENPPSYYRDSGRINAIAVDPANANHWLIGASTGGVWETTDGGASWASRTDDQITLAIGALAFAPSNANIVYAGLGDPMSGQYYVGGYGVLKSTNGGTNWQLISSPPITGTAFKRLFVDPNDANTVVGAALPSFLVPDFFFPSQGGIYRSTDGGVSWTRTLTGSTSGLAVAPTHFNQQYAGNRSSGFGTSATGVYRSTNGGQSWTLISGPWSPGSIPRFELAFAPSATNTLYVGISASSNLIGLWRTDNAWDATPTWTQVPMDAAMPNGYCASQCFFDHIISVDPANANTLYAGGVSLWKCANCGASPTWTRLPIGSGSFQQKYFHVDQHSMAWAGSRLLLGDDGGLYSTTDGGATWNSHNLGLATNQFYAGTAHPTNANQLMGGLQDNGVQRRSASNSWTPVTYCDGVSTAIAANNPDTHWAYGCQRLLIARTTDGANFDEMVVSGGIDTSNAPFIAYFEKCPANDNIFIAGTDKVWRTTDFFSSAPLTPTWTANSPVLGFGNGVTALAFAPSDCNTYAVGTYGGISLTTNGGVNWIDLSAGLPDRAISDLAFDPTNANILYATVSGFNTNSTMAGHVFKTTSAASGTPNWSDISTPVDIPHNTIVVDPQNVNSLYVGTDLGVWKTTNGGGNWTHDGPTEGMPNVAVTDLEINRTTNRLHAFTYGRSVFMLDISAPAALSSVSVSGSTVGLTDAPYAFTATVNPTNVSTPITYTWSATNQAPVAPRVSNAISDTITFTWAISATHTITVTAQNSSGAVTSNAHTIAIRTATKVYLPLVVR